MVRSAPSSDALHLPYATHRFLARLELVLHSAHGAREESELLLLDWKLLRSSNPQMVLARRENPWIKSGQDTKSEVDRHLDMGELHMVQDVEGLGKLVAFLGDMLEQIQLVADRDVFMF